MFSNSYQSGMHIELYNVQNKDTVKNWKVSGKITKEYDSGVKGYVSLLNVAGLSKLQIPKDEKTFLGIVQPFLVFQVYIFTPKSLSIEIAISDTSKTKRRLMFSASSKEVVVNPLHCRVPLSNLPVGIWLNLSIDVLSFVGHCFKSQTFRSIDYISITANCKIRRIFSMRTSLVECNAENNDEFQVEYADILPKNLSIPSSVSQQNINLTIEKVLETELTKENSNLGNNLMNINPNLLSGGFSNSGNINLLNSGNLIKGNQIKQTTNSAVNNKNGPVRKSAKDSRSKSQLKNVELASKGEFIKISPQNISSNISNTKPKNFQNLNPAKKSNEKIISDSKPVNIFEDNFISDNKLLNTLNYKNEDRWEVDNLNDSIEEIYEIEEKKIPNNLDLKQSRLEQAERENKNLKDSKYFKESYGNITAIKNTKNDDEDKFYCDIPIKENKKPNFKETEDCFSPKVTGSIKAEVTGTISTKADLDAKKKIIEEILKDSQTSMILLEKERPYTPPFTKLVPMTSLKSLDRAAAIIERAKEEVMTSEIFTSSTPNLNDLRDSLNLQQSLQINDDNYLDLIYDHVLGCYYDPKTNMYYELKN